MRGREQPRTLCQANTGHINTPFSPVNCLATPVKLGLFLHGGGEELEEAP